MLADFCNILTAVNQSEVPLYKDPDDDLTLLILEEDRLLSGFVPLLAAPQDPCYVEKTSDKVSPRPNITPHSPFLLILQTFLFLGSFLCKRNMIKSLRRVLRENIDLLAADIQLCVLKKKKALSTSFGVCVCLLACCIYDHFLTCLNSPACVGSALTQLQMVCIMLKAPSFLPPSSFPPATKLCTRKTARAFSLF